MILLVVAVHTHTHTRTHIHRNQPRRQKKWWSAYLLFYDRISKDGSPLTNRGESCTSVVFTCIVHSIVLIFIYVKNCLCLSKFYCLLLWSPFPDPVTEVKCLVPSPILKMVHRRNLEFLHTRSHFSHPYFQFMKQLLILNYNFTKTQLDQGTSNEVAVSKTHVCLAVCLCHVITNTYMLCICV